MEVSRCIITIGLLGAILLGSAAADIMIQPGYEQKNHETQVSDDAEQVPTTQGPSSRQLNSELADEFERYRSLHRVIEGQLDHLIHEQNYQDFHQTAPEVGAVPMNFRPRLIRPLQHPLLGTRSFYLSPVGSYGFYPRGYEFRRHPYREAEQEPYQQPDYDAAARNQWTRSVDGGPRIDGDVVDEVQDVAAQSTLNTDGVDGIVVHQVPENTTTDEATGNKRVEPRQIGYRDDAVVGSPLARIHYENPRDSRDQHHPSETMEVPSNLMRVASVVGNIIDSVAPVVMNYENRDSASAMTRHEEPAPNYRHDSQYPPSSENGQRTDYTSVRKAPTVSSNSKPMTGQSYNSQQHPRNSGWSSIQPTQNSHAAKTSSGVHYSQTTPGAYPASSNYMNNKNWQSTIHSHHPVYPNYRPDNQNYYGRPPTGSYRPQVNGAPFYPSGASSSASAIANNPGFGNAHSGYNHAFNYPSGVHSSDTASADNQSDSGSGLSFYNHGSHYPSGATSSAAASANNNPTFANGHSSYNYGFPYANSATASATANSGNYGYNYRHRSLWNNAYGARNPHASTNFVDQFGRTLFNLIPSSFNSLSTIPANYQAYLENFVHNRIPDTYRQSGYWY